MFKEIHYQFIGGVFVLVGWFIDRFELPIISGFLMGIGIMFVIYANKISKNEKI